jgi:serine protease Do
MRGWSVVLFAWVYWLSTCLGLVAEEASVDLLREEEAALRAAADFAQPSVVRIETFGGREIVDDAAVAAGPSSGTVVAEDGWIITSLFQFRGEPAAITVILPNGTRKAAKLVARDYARALALLKVEVDEKLIPAKPSPRQRWQIGQWTVALGKTFDLSVASRSIGILSAIDRIFGRAIQTDCKVSPHNYGGPLIDIEGRVMGILAPIDPGIATEGEVQQWYDSGIGFAIPLEDVLQRLPKLMQGQDIHLGKAGIRPKVNDDFRGPVILAGVAPGTPAAKAGLQAGDQLVRIGDTEIRWPNHMRHALGTVDAGEAVSMTITRDGQSREVECRLVDTLPVYRRPFLGVLVDRDYPGPGVKLEAVYPGSPAADAGLQAGQVLQRIQGAQVESPVDLDRRLAFADYREPLACSLASREKADAETDERMVRLSPWPDELQTQRRATSAASEKPADEAAEATATGVVPLVMGDIPNQIFAFVPPTYRKTRPHGLLVVMPEPGKVERKSWVDRWEVFCREHRYLLAVIGSADPTAWQREELEVVKRTIQQLKTTYAVDSRRTVLAGFGAGGAPAMVFALQNRSLFRGLWLAEGNIPRGLGLPQAEPLESPAFLLLGSQPAYPRFAEAAGELGYRIQRVEGKVEVADGSFTAEQQQAAEQFLSSLEWF